MTAARPVRVHKFGGTSVATADRIRRVVQLVQAEPETARRVVVVSALGGVTDQLLGCIDAALARTGAHCTTIEALRQRHQEVLEALVLPEERTALEAQLNAHWQALTELLDGLYLLRECTPRTRDAIISFGERLSAPLVAAAFRAAGSEAIALEATELIRTDDTFGEANVDFATTNRLIRERFAAIPEDQIVVVTGFIGSTPEGVTTTLGRSGSDYTATILGAALDAELVVIWTDVDGVMSADPRLVPEAFVLPHLSYREAAEMAYFGAKVLHPRTMEPLQAKGIPLRIRNTLNPAAPGTLITAEAPPPPWYVRAVTAIRDVAVLMLEGPGCWVHRDLRDGHSRRWPSIKSTYCWSRRLRASRVSVWACGPPMPRRRWTCSGARSPSNWRPVASGASTLCPNARRFPWWATACATSRDWPDACSRRSGRPT